MRAAGATTGKNRTATHDVPTRRGGALAVIEADFLAGTAVRQIALVGVSPAAQAHADAIRGLEGIELAGIVDADLERARDFAWRNGGIAAAASLGELLAARRLDAVHILARDRQRADVMHDALALGLSVLAESPLAGDCASADALVRAAGSAAGALAANHHFLFHPAFVRLADAIASRRHGPLVGLSANIALPPQHPARTPVIDSADLLLTEAAHPLSQILSLIGPVAHWNVMAAPANGERATPRTLALSLCGEVCEAQLDLRFDATYPVWQITAFCADGVLKADILRNRFLCEERSKNSPALDNFLEARRLGHEMLRQACRNLLTYGRTLMGPARRPDAVQQSLADSIAAFHGRKVAGVSTPVGAAAIVRLCEDIAAQTLAPSPARPRAPIAAAFRADAVVLGGTGFLGRQVVDAFARRGLKVAAVSRSPTGQEDSDQIRFFRGDVLDADALVRLMDGSAFLINATALEAGYGWPQYERRSQRMIANLIAACRQSGVKRLVHLSSLDALYLGDKYDLLTGRAPPDPYDWQRGPCSRAKGFEEIALLTAYEEGMLPVSILRPGIVLGSGGTPYPAAVGQFVNFRHCLGWNKGLNPLPFVLAEDVALAVLAAAERDVATGRCFNLVGDVRPTAREYVAALSRVLQRPFQFHPRSPERIYLAQRLKAGLRNRDGLCCSRRDLASRTMAATFDCADAKAALGWAPVSDREIFLARGLAVHAPRPGAGA